MSNLFLSTSCGYQWDQIKAWNLSAKATGNKVCNILINPSNDLINACSENGVDVVANSFKYANKPPHNLRFIMQYKYLMSVKDVYSHVVLTDSRDVYFHSDPFPRIKEILDSTNKDIVCGSECIAYEDEHWGNRNLAEGFGYVYEEYKRNEICNVGVLCGKTEAIAELCLLIFSMCYHNPASVSDQSSFNVLMGTRFGEEKIAMVRPEDGLMVHLGTVGVHSFRDKLMWKPTWEDGAIPSVGGNVIPILHQYDRVDTSKWGL